MLRTLPTLFFLASFANLAVGQGAAERCAEALLRGDQQAAAAAASSASDPALRARLQAALLPPLRRPAGMLAVAARYPKSPEADLAILAGAANLLVLRDNGGALPELAAWNGFEDCGASSWESLPWPVIRSLWRALEQRRANGGDLAVLAEAEQLLLRSSVSRFGFEPARIAPGAGWSLPERREDLLLRAWRRQPGRSGWRELEQRGAAELQVSLPRSSHATIPALQSGDWLVELASTSTRWRGIRAVEVSDLDVVTLAAGNRVALAAWRNGALTPEAQWWHRRQGTEAVRGSFEGGVAMLSASGIDEANELFVQAGGQRARVPLTRGYSHRLSEDRFQVHVMVDRPIHRPGDLIQGRVIVRQTNYEGAGVDAVAHSAPFANRTLELQVFADEDEVRIAGRTDSQGVYRFEVQVPETAAHGSVPLALRIPDRDPIYEGAPCSVAAFRRSPILLETVGAQSLPQGVDTTVALRAAWASGAPAANMQVRAKLRVWNRQGIRFRESYDLATDAAGLATLSLPLRLHEATYVRVNFRVATPSGPKDLTHRIAVRDTKPADLQPKALPRGNRPQVNVPELVVVGKPCTVRLRGAAHEQGLLVADRGKRSQPHPVQFDANGEATVTLTPTREAWPALDLCIATASGSSELRVPILLRTPKQLEITLPRSAEPGASVPCRIATGIPDSAVTVAVVDERIFAIAADRTPDPGKALRPVVARPWWRHAASAAAIAPSQLMDSLLVDGRVPASDRDGRVDAGIAAPGAGGPAPAAPGKLRTRFRATAAFLTGVADANGVAEFALALPDDLTTWRVSIVTVAPDGSGYRTRRQLTTRTPLSAEPVLPRVLRVGDVVAVPIAVDRKADVTGGTTVKVSASCADATATVADGEQELTVTAGSAASASVTLRGVTAGDAKLTLSASVGDCEDRSQRKLPVRPDAILRPRSAAAMGTGKFSVRPPEGAIAANHIDVTVLGGSSAAWHEIERRLSKYPYGCVEQTLAKLLPFFASARAAKIHGTEPPVADEGFSQRLLAGLRRMRQLQIARGGSFAFWPGEQADRDMTVLVMHGLAVMRAGGLDPARFGIDCDPRRSEFANAIANLQARNGVAAKPGERLEIELAAALLRLHPDAADARAALVAAIDVQQPQPLPAGLLLRAGLALLAADDAPRAQQCLRRAASRIPRNASGSSPLPGDDPLATLALQLELRCLLQPDAAPAELTANVLVACLSGYSSTYAQACALSALALAVPRAGSEAFTVRLQAGEAHRELTLSPRNRFTARVRLPKSVRCSVVGPDQQQILVRAVAQQQEPGSTHVAWSNPMVVERNLCRRDANATKQQRRANRDLVPIDDGTIRVGEVVWLRLRVRSSQLVRYVVVDCPLPAGLEPAEDLAWLERFDDRVALSCSRVDDRPREYCIPLVATLTGRFVWPPATAAPMYADGRDGGTAGSKLTVLPAAQASARPSRVACCVEVPRAAPREATKPTKRDQFLVAMSQLDDAFDDEHETRDGQLRTALTTAMQACDAACQPSAVPGYVLEELTDAVVDWREQLAEEVSTGSLRSVRMAACHAVLQEQQRRALQAIDAFEHGAASAEDTDVVDELILALLAWPDRAMREPAAARVLEIALARDAVPESVLENFAGEAEHDGLRSVLRTMLAWHPERHGEHVLRLLPIDELRGIAPTALLRAAQDEWPEWLLDVLLESRLGQLELKRRLQNPRFAIAHIETLQAKLPARHWRAIPLPVFAALARYDFEGMTLVNHLADANVGTAELQRELREARDTQWQATIARALARRGVQDLGVDGESQTPQVAAWQRALALRRDDAGGALRLLADARNDLGLGLSLFCGFVTEIILRHGSPAQLATVVPDADEAEVLEVLHRLDRPAVRALLALVAGPIAPLPIAREQADCTALWDYASRLQAHDEVLATLCRSDIGLRFAERQIAATTDPELRESLLHELRFLRGLDTETGLPDPGEPWLSMLQDVAHRGIQPTWTHAQRRRFDRLRRMRGVR